MAKVKESTKEFKLIEASRGEMFTLGSYGICDHCNEITKDGVYIAVLNHWTCKRCFEEWHNSAVNYEEDRDIEERNFAAYKDALGVK